MRRNLNGTFEERRMIKELQDVTLPGRVKEIEEICGAPIPYDVDWASLADDKAELNFLDNVSMPPAEHGAAGDLLRRYGQGSDPRWIEELVRLVNVKSNDDKKMTFEGGVLEMHVPYALGGSGLISDNEIRGLLLQHL